MALPTRAQEKAAKAAEEARRRQARSDQLAQMRQTSAVIEERRGLPPPTPVQSQSPATPAGTSQQNPAVVQASGSQPSQKCGPGRPRKSPPPGDDEEVEPWGVEVPRDRVPGPGALVLDRVQIPKRPDTGASPAVGILRGAAAATTPQPQRRVSFGDIEWRPILDAAPGERTCASLGTPANSDSSDDVDEEAQKNETVNEKTRLPLAGRRPHSRHWIHDWTRYKEEGELFRDPAQPQPDGTVQEDPARVSLRQRVCAALGQKLQRPLPQGTPPPSEDESQTGDEEDSAAVPVRPGQAKLQPAPIPPMPVQQLVPSVQQSLSASIQSWTDNIPCAVRVVVMMAILSYIFEQLATRSNDS
ncbi:uncharacterized protein BDZ99DRAFT_568838 [Mytilinidion resinicola]|uniref:Uncharacterized protein n=1 Tax=Mytilinidion resinicola TaxID=574789 RepID=A0A6A6YU66_9PEZI|nr:uncharacterized protein BDZ99DRAFT_568838 [Mytilinidion resinicola]KAF2812088.1 hypothetical protein BDZ99DRAFT_568838 [Mytilinidion resinicola]